jgi:hypothetical protein
MPALSVFMPQSFGKLGYFQFDLQQMLTKRIFHSVDTHVDNSGNPEYHEEYSSAYYHLITDSPVFELTAKDQHIHQQEQDKTENKAMYGVFLLEQIKGSLLQCPDAKDDPSNTEKDSFNKTGTPQPGKILYGDRKKSEEDSRDGC